MPRYRPHLTPEEVLAILTSQLPTVAIAQQIGCSRSSVHAIRTGRVHAGLFPTIARMVIEPRPDRDVCDQCSNWQPGGGCSLRYAGPAAECMVYDPR